MPHLAGLLQNAECLGHLLRFHQGIGPVEQQHIQILGVQTGQAALHRLQDMLLGAIIGHAGQNGALGLDKHLLPQGGGHGKGLGEKALRFPAAVNIGMVEKVHPVFQGGVQKMVGLAFLQRIDAHAAQSDGRGLQHASQ